VSPAVALELGYLNSFQERANRWIILIEILFDSVSFIRLNIIQVNSVLKIKKEQSDLNVCIGYSIKLEMETLNKKINGSFKNSNSRKCR
jgi:hypothetical protein